MTRVHRGEASARRPRDWGGRDGTARSPLRRPRPPWSAPSSECRAPSGTRSIVSVCPPPQVRKLYAKLSTLSLAARRKVTGIGPRRAEIIVPGLAVLLRVPDGVPSAGHVLFARRSPRRHHRGPGGPQRRRATSRGSSREQRAEVEEMCRRYGVSLAHGRKVASIAHELYTALQPLHQFPAATGKLLEAAAYLHDVGHYVSSSDITSIPVTWWRTRTCPASRSASAS